MASEQNTLFERVKALENEVQNLKNHSINDDKKSKKDGKVKKEKKPRAQTEYNKFVSIYINEQKEKLGNDFNHKIAFAEAAKNWNEKKQKQNETNNETINETN